MQNFDSHSHFCLVALEAFSCSCKWTEFWLFGAEPKGRRVLMWLATFNGHFRLLHESKVAPWSALFWTVFVYNLETKFGSLSSAYVAAKWSLSETQLYTSGCRVPLTVGSGSSIIGHLDKVTCPLSSGQRGVCDRLSFYNIWQQ